MWEGFYFLNKKDVYKYCKLFLPFSSYLESEVHLELQQLFYNHEENSKKITEMPVLTLSDH